MYHKKRVLIFLVFFLLYSLVFEVNAESISTEGSYEENINLALEWLRTNQNEDGSWGEELRKVYTSSVVEILSKYSYLLDSKNKGISWMIENHPNNNDYLSRYLTIDEIMEYYSDYELVKSQNQDGGWGLADGFESDSLDTVLTLKALINSNDLNMDVIKRSVEYLLSQQNDNGSWSYISSDIGNKDLTARIALTLSNVTSRTGFTSNNLDTSIRKAGEYLLSVRGDDGTWGLNKENIITTINSYGALLNIMGQNVVAGVDEKIVELQGVNGSWYEDSRITSLIITLLKEKEGMPYGRIDDIKTYKNVSEVKTETNLFKPYETALFEIEGEYNREEVFDTVLIRTPDGKIIGTENEGYYFWNTENNQPGEYTVIATIKDKLTGKVIDTLEENITIEEEFNIANIILDIDPESIRVNSTKTPSILLSLINQSNINGEINIKTTITDDSNNIVKEVESSKICNYNEEIINLPTITFSPVTDSPKDYKISTVVTYEDKIISQIKTFKVLPPPPPTRIDITQDLNKEVLYPGNDDITGVFNLLGEGTPEGPARKPIDIIIAIDDSGSMEWGNRDWSVESPNRLDYAKDAAKFIVDLLQPEDRGAIVEFAGTAWIQQALTSDKELLKSSIDDTPESPWDGTSMGRGLRKSIEIIDDYSNDERQKVIVLLCDGDENVWSSWAVRNEANTASSKNIKVYTIGLGVSSSHTLLKTIASITGGSYIHSPTMEELKEMMSILVGGIFDTAGKDVKLTTTVVDNGGKIDVSSFRPEPTNIIDNNDGSKTITWEYDKIIMGQQEKIEINFNGTNLVSDTNVILTKDTILTYLDKFDSEVIVELPNLEIPVNLYKVDTVIKTDKSKYSSNENVEITIEAKNLTEYPSNLIGKIKITDDAGNLVDIIEKSIEVTWEGGENKTFVYSWNTDKILASGYKAVIKWFEGEKKISSSETVFEIIGDGAIENDVITDAKDYGSRESIVITDTIKNTNTNMIEKDLNIKTIIKDSNNTIIWTNQLDIRELLPGEVIKLNSNWDTEQNQPGEYTIISTVYKDDIVISETSTVFDILPSDEVSMGVDGSIEILKKTIYPIDSLDIKYEILNIGNVDLNNLELRIRIIDPVTGDVVNSISNTLNLLVNESYSETLELKNGELYEGNYLLVYDVVLNNGVTVTLGSTGFEVIRPYEISKMVVNRPRVLLWGENEESINLAIESLNGMDVYYKVVNSPSTFIEELKTDKYNLYLLLDSKLPLTGHDDDILAREIENGKGIIVTRHGNGDDFKNIDLFGAKFNGYIQSKEYIVDLESLLPSENMKLEGTGKIQDVVVDEGQVLGTISTKKGSLPGIIYNQYGKGNALLMTFDLANVKGNVEGLINKAIELTTPKEELSGDIKEIEIRLNSNGFLEGKIKELLPDGVEIIWTLPLIEDNNQWTFTLEDEEEYVVRYIIRLPEDYDEIKLTTESYYFVEEQYKKFEENILEILKP